MSETANIISARGLAKTYREGPQALTVLRSIDIDIVAGESVAIIGASGSGKSTLLHLLGGLDNASAGTVSVAGRPMGQMNEAERGRLRNAALGFVYQFHHLLPDFTALENVAMPLIIRGGSRAEAEAAARAVLDSVGLASRVDHTPGELSGGERQRAALARALVTRPQCVLADEPTGNLDRENAARVFDLMLDLKKRFNTAFVVVTHDPALAARLDRKFELREGALAAL
ncbi:MAG: lolD [Betaproteobacteria bacterium]|nr:lolD [Betaproteobacteria bacterium]